jgi:hypothetical protein
MRFRAAPDGGHRSAAVGTQHQTLLRTSRRVRRPMSESPPAVPRLAAHARAEPITAWGPKRSHTLRGPRALTCPTEGVRWSVYEMAAGEIPGRRGPTCLVFDSAAYVRRVWAFPADWLTLSDDVLLALSRGR